MFSRFIKSLPVIVLTLGCCQASRAIGGASFSDTPLPSPDLGYDRLLAESVQGAYHVNYPPTDVAADTWTTDLLMSETNTRDADGNLSGSPLDTKSGVFSGSGPTGTYPDTIGTGKHSENTIGDMSGSGGWWRSPATVYYQYIFHYTYHDYEGKATTVDKPDIKGIHSYTF